MKNLQGESPSHGLRQYGSDWLNRPLCAGCHIWKNLISTIFEKEMGSSGCSHWLSLSHLSLVSGMGHWLMISLIRNPFTKFFTVISLGFKKLCLLSYPFFVITVVCGVNSPCLLGFSMSHRWFVEDINYRWTYKFPSREQLQFPIGSLEGFFALH